MSIVLPVSSGFYQKVRDGQQMPHACGLDDLVSPSLNLILEAAAERPDLLGLTRTNPTESLRITLLHQIAALARCNRIRRSDTLRILSFAGTPTNADRLLANHFLPTGRTLPRSGLAIYELKVQVGHLAISDVFNVAMLYLLGFLCPEVPAFPND
jgi:hypothetical protein